MNDPGNFLSRWSRRKREAGEDKEKNETGKTVAAPTPENEQDKPGTPGTAPVLEFDVESLPPIESISAETDITAFMRTSVPETLKRAALRRAWSADPAIRDFWEPTENYWDTAGPDGIPGFGDLDPNLDVQRLVSELFGETPRQESPPQSGTDRVADCPVLPIQSRANATDVPPESPTASEDVPQRNENAAAQIEQQDSTPEKKISRRHGGAIPR
jgi:hypothetical protein